MNAPVSKRNVVAGPTANYRSPLLRVAALALLILALSILLAPHVAAQGCAMCYQNAVSSGAQGRAALRRGILILLLPALSLFIGILALMYCRRDSAGTGPLQSNRLR
jgi:hypothetical protein